MDIRPGYMATLIALVAAVPAAAYLITGEWLALGTFACVAVIGVFFWYLFDGGEPDSRAANH
ncbi:hypothetical protein [Halorubellus sp. PRR65]|uniref:hypothetical protein n=1 Tax=Halorubellus sp. PRR65 TaxID=3098148 RepID=UPI002B25ECF1|nr:hypothetical protein [Halorubellus sp. PRR65]